MSKLLEEIGISKTEIIEIIVNRALGFSADCKQTGEETWEDIPLALAVNEKLEKAIGNLVDKMKPLIQVQIEKIMTIEIEKVFTSPFQPVNQWNEPKGPVTTIRDMIAVEAQNYWNTKVDKNGKPDNSYGSNNIRAEYYAKQVMTEVYNNELVKVVKEMAANLKSMIPKTLGEEITKTVVSYLK